jgi:hypothetical protein
MLLTLRELQAADLRNLQLVWSNPPDLGHLAMARALQYSSSNRALVRCPAGEMDMSLKALIATLVLGSSSLALAAPVVRDHRALPAPAQLRVQSRVDARWFRPLPMTRTILADDVKLTGPRTNIALSNAKAYTGLELSSDGRGKVSVDRVVVHFGNGTTQIVNLNATVSPKTAPISIDLTGNARFITRIDVLGSTRGRKAGLDIVGIKRG